VIPPVNTRLVRVFSQNESRYDLRAIRRRRLTAQGVQPVGSFQHVFEWCDGYGAVELTTGGRFFPEWPYLNAEMFQLLMLLPQAFPDHLNRPCWTTVRRTPPPTHSRGEHISALPAPELHPIERVWYDDLAWLSFADLDAQ